MRKGMRLSGKAQQNLTSLKSSWGGGAGKVVERAILEATIGRQAPDKKGFTFLLSERAVERLSIICQSWGMTETEAMSTILYMAVQEKPVPKKVMAIAPNLGKRHIPGGRR